MKLNKLIISMALRERFRPSIRIQGSIKLSQKCFVPYL